MDVALLYRLGIAVGLGLLVGLQRERSRSAIAGIRTFPLIAVLGLLTGWVGQRAGSWIIGAGLLALAALIIIGNLLRWRSAEDPDPGLTTEVAALVMFVLGVALSLDALLEVIVGASVVALLLHWKEPLHAFAERLGAADFAAIMRLALLGLVILPALPNRAYGPYDVLNPFQIWLMVVLISGISLAGYVVFRLLGERAGAWAAGVLGGLISSTATTVGYARRTRHDGTPSGPAALVVTLASAVVFGRVLVELALVAPSAFAATALPLSIMLVGMVLLSRALLAPRADAPHPTDTHAPSDLRAALGFGLLYGVVLLAVAWAEDRFGQRGMFVVAALSGLTDMDAITLSTAQLMRTGGVAAETGWRVILVGGLANITFKLGVAALLGSAGFRRRVGAVFGLALLGGVILLAAWPG